MKNGIFAVAALLALTGCATQSPVMQDRAAWQRVPLSDKEEQLRLSYLARYMIEVDERAELEQLVAESPAYKGWQRSDTVSSLMLKSDLSGTTDSSLLGNQLATGIAVGGVLWDAMVDGSMDRVSQAYLPRRLNGVELDSEDKANKALFTMVGEQLSMAAQSFGWQLECVQGCGGSNQVYLIRDTAKALVGYGYQPENICFQTDITEVKRVRKTDPVNAILGFDAQWKTSDGNTLVLNGITDCLLDSQGKLVVKNLAEKNIDYPEGSSRSRYLEETLLGKRFLSRVYNNPYFFSGTQKRYPNMFFYNGKVYSFVLNSRALLINYELDISDAVNPVFEP